MNTPAYLNLMFINTTIKGNMKEFIKHVQKSKSKPGVRITP